MALSPGTRLGPYEIRDPVGAGGMGEVYRARDSRLGRDVAIKVLPEHLAQRPDFLARFQKEAKAVAALSHPNILAIHDFGTEGGVTYAVTELLEGETLRSRLRGASVPWRKVVEIAAAVAEGLAAAHSKGIIHRDLKPENIFLTSDGWVKILDFGLARVKPAPTAEGESAIPTETDPGTMMGTVGYMSPEQVRGGVADAPSDIFSLGCVVHEMISGANPFARASAGETMAAILKEDPPPLEACPLELERIVRRCLEKRSGERFQSARDLGFALRGVTNGPRVHRRTFPRIWMVAALVLFLVAVSVYWFLARRTYSGGSITSLAVLPLVAGSGGLDTESLGDGIAESTISSLSRFPELKVISFSAAARFKGQKVDPQEVGRHLKVETVLVGRIAQQGENLLIRVELVNVNDGVQMWGEQYNLKMADIFTMQDEIGRQISERMRLRLTGEQKKALAKRYTKNPEAYQEYVKARYFWNKRSGESLKAAIVHFEKAISKDPAYALAYAGLADSYAVQPIYAAMPPRENYATAEAAARRALDMDADLAEAYPTLALLKSYRYDWVGAESDYKNALALNPGYATTHNFYAEYLGKLGRFEEALVEAKRSQELDPVSPIISVTFGQIYVAMRRYDQGIEQFRNAVALDPNWSFGHNNLAVAYLEKSSYSEAIAELQTAVRLGGAPITAAHLARAYARSGNRAEAEKILQDLLARAKAGYVLPLAVALIYIDLGDQDRAFEWLEKAFEDRISTVSWVKVYPFYDPLRSDPRFADLLRRMNLVP